MPKQVEVTNVSKHGFWIFLDDEEMFLPFVEFPWFEVEAYTSPTASDLIPGR
ncbi:MAG TPA: hypothetical protein VGS22_28210 [Thermoanaerobaculia bacterium]|nr:hypothetical protein [Thermoanaerobaculia bacterium]